MEGVNRKCAQVIVAIFLEVIDIEMAGSQVTDFRGRVSADEGPRDGKIKHRRTGRRIEDFRLVRRERENFSRIAGSSGKYRWEGGQLFFFPEFTLIAPFFLQSFEICHRPRRIIESV